MSHFVCEPAFPCMCESGEEDCGCIPLANARGVIACVACGAAMIRTCIACGCTDDRACEGGCSWVSDTEACCSACVAAASTLRPAVYA